MRWLQRLIVNNKALYQDIQMPDPDSDGHNSLRASVRSWPSPEKDTRLARLPNASSSRWKRSTRICATRGASNERSIP